MDNNLQDNDKPVFEFKTETDGLEVEFEVSPINNSLDGETHSDSIDEEIFNIDKKISANQDIIDKINADIDRLTSNADGWDYSFAALSGVISGILDSFVVGETVIDKEKIQKELEKRYRTPNDSAYKHKDKNGNWISSAMYHRLDDLAHHPTLWGLVAAILVRFLRLTFFIDGSDGKPHMFLADKPNNKNVFEQDMKKLGLAWTAAILSGLLYWLSTMVEKKYYDENNQELPQPLKKLIKAIAATPIIIELLDITDTWIGHIMSDVSTPQGIPGVFLSFLKELSSLPLIKKSNLAVIVDSMYRKGSHNLSEWGGVVFVACKTQSIPIIINKTLVRGFYFIRNLVDEINQMTNISQLNWETIIPFGNRTIERMMSIATATFTTIDIADAAIRSGGFKNPQILLRINYVGIGRFVIAIGVDASMGIKKANLQNERIAICCEQLYLLNAKIFYKQANMWIAAKDAEDATEEAVYAMNEAIILFNNAFQDINNDLNKIKGYIPLIEEKNPGLIDDINDILIWG